MTFRQQIKRARHAGVPIIAVNTPDPRATMEHLVESVSETTPIVCWDCMIGFNAVNASGKKALGMLENSVLEEAEGSPVAFLEACRKLPETTMVCFLQSDAWINEPMVIQGIWNLRDSYKQTDRTLVLLACQLQLPVNLQGDVISFEEELPDKKELEAIAKDMDEVAREANPSRIPLTPEDLSRVVETTTGLTSFLAEQAVAMSLNKEGVDFDCLWDNRMSMIEQTKGLSVDRDKTTFDDIGGIEQVKKFGRKLFESPHPFSVVVRIEEIEKAMGGAGSDSSGTSQDALQVMLTCMEDYNWAGIMAFGCPGGGKSLYSKGLANTFGKLSLCLDLNACKDSLVGNSEKNIREAMRVIRAIGGDRVFCVATANRLNTVPGELKRRFRYGIWMFDFPTDDERAKIWPIHRKKFDISDDDPLPDDKAYAGSDIRNCCELAWRMGVSLKEASQFLGPVGKVASDVISDSRKLADGRFLSAVRSGLYSVEDAEKSGKRRKVKVS